jgi:hypothetical protein
VTDPPPFWDPPPELQSRCPIIAGTAWLVLGIVFFISFVGSWGFLSAAILFWALGAIPAAFFTVRWLQPTGGVRVTAARLLFVCCCALAIGAFVLFAPLVDWKRTLPRIVLWLPLVLSLWGAVLGFLGRAKRTSASA